jgi:hypothetical protein
VSYGKLRTGTIATTMSPESKTGRSGSEVRRPQDGMSDFPVETNLAASHGELPANVRAANDADALSLFGSEGSAGSTAFDPVERERSEDPLRSIRKRLVDADSKTRGSRLLGGLLTSAGIPFRGSVFTASSVLMARVRNYLVQHPKLPVRAASIACVLIAGLILRQTVGGSVAVTPAASPAPTSYDSARDSSLPTTISTPPVQNPIASARATTGAGSSPAVEKTPVAKPKVATANATQPLQRTEPARVDTRRSAPVTRRTETSPTRQPGAASPAVTPATPDRPSPPALLRTPSTPQATTIQNDENSNVIYSAKDAEVRPPEMLEAELPRPAVAAWATIRNSMEVVVAEDGSVERVKWLASPQRMPDVMLLSRAKLWKFAPAVKEGHPVRYRLVLTWEVNP